MFKIGQVSPDEPRLDSAVLNSQFRGSKKSYPDLSLLVCITLVFSGQDGSDPKYISSPLQTVQSKC